MTYRTTFCYPEEWFQDSLSSGFISFMLWTLRKRAVPWRLTPPATGRTTAVFSRVLGLIPVKICGHKDTARYVLSYSNPFGLRPKNIAPRKENFSENRSYRTSPASIILLFYLTWFYVIFR